MLRIIGKLLRATRGATAVEYGLISAVVVLAMLVGLRNVAGITIDMWNMVSRNTIEASEATAR